MSNLLILGAGGFGHMVYECARQSGKYDEIAFLDDAAKDSRVIGKCVDYQIWREKFPHAVAAFGNNRMRLAWVEKLQEAGFDVPCLCHSSAIVSPSVQMEAGCFVMQRAVLNTHVKLGKGVLINSGAIVDHDSDVGDGAHVGLGSVVKANCHIAPLRKVEAGEMRALPFPVWIAVVFAPAMALTRHWVAQPQPAVPPKVRTALEHAAWMAVAP